MMLTRWNPSSELVSLHTAMDRLFTDVFGNLATADGDGERRLPTYQLPIDVIDEGKAYVIKAPVAGFKPEQVEVTFDHGVLTISAKAETKSETKDGKYLRREWATGNLFRQIGLPGEVDGNGISADFEDGTLTVTIPKISPPEPKKIPVTTSNNKS